MKAEKIEEYAPVAMLDGKFGMVIRVPTALYPMVGIQVPGEEDIRWREPSRIAREPLREILKSDQSRQVSAKKDENKA